MTRNIEISADIVLVMLCILDIINLFVGKLSTANQKQRCCKCSPWQWLGLQPLGYPMAGSKRCDAGGTAQQPSGASSTPVSHDTPAVGETGDIRMVCGLCKQVSLETSQDNRMRC